MKKLIPLLLVVLTFAACEKDPDTDKLDNKYLVYTNYDSKADFKALPNVLHAGQHSCHRR